MNVGEGDVWWSLMVVAAWASDGEDQATELARAALLFERQGAFEDATRACQMSRQVSPNGPFAGKCTRLIEHLAPLADDDGAYDGWRAVTHALDNAHVMGREATRTSLVTVRAMEQTSPMVQWEIDLWLAHDDRTRLSRPEAALQRLTPHRDTRHTLDERRRRDLIAETTAALSALKRFEEASALEAEVRLDANWPRLPPVEQAQRRERQMRVTPLASAILGIFTISTLPYVASLRRHPKVPWGLLPIAGLGLGTWWLAEGWAEGAGDGVPRMVLGLCLVHLLTLAAPQRRWRQLLAVLATLAVGYLSLATTQTLDWIGV